MAKTYKQPEWAGGKTVLAKDVPNSFWTIYFTEDDPNMKSHVTVLKHENSMCKTYKELGQMFNYYPTSQEAQQAKRDIKKVLQGGL